MPGHRQPSGLAFAIRDPLPWNDLVGIVRAAENAGYRALFLPEISGRDALVTLGALARDTHDLLLGTGVLPMRSRTPLLTAMGSATVDERSGGRLLLGLGPGPVGRGALDELAELIGTLRSLFAGGTIERRGRPVGLSLLPSTEIPIWISAMGPKAMRLAGEIADGALLNWCSPERAAFAKARIAEGAEAAGRDPTEIALGVYVRSWVGQDAEAAMTASPIRRRNTPPTIMAMREARDMRRKRSASPPRSGARLRGSPTPRLTADALTPGSAATARRTDTARCSALVRGTPGALLLMI